MCEGSLLTGKTTLDNRKKGACMLGKGVQKSWGPPTSIAYELICDFRICQFTSQSVSSSIKLEVKTLSCPPQVTCWRRSFYIKGKWLYISNIYFHCLNVSKNLPLGTTLDFFFPCRAKWIVLLDSLGLTKISGESPWLVEALHSAGATSKDITLSTYSRMIGEHSFWRWRS